MIFSDRRALTVQSSQSRSRDPSMFKESWKGLAFWGLLVLLQGQLLVEYFTRLWKIEAFQFFPVLFLAISMLFYLNWSGDVRLPRNLFTIFVISFAIVTAGMAAYWGSPWMAVWQVLFAWVLSFTRKMRSRHPVGECSISFHHACLFCGYL